MKFRWAGFTDWVAQRLFAVRLLQISEIVDVQEAYKTAQGRVAVPLQPSARLSRRAVSGNKLKCVPRGGLAI